MTKLSTYEQTVVKRLLDRQKQARHKYGKGNYGPALSAEEWQAAIKYYTGELYTCIIFLRDGALFCDTTLVYQYANRENGLSRCITARGEVASRYTLKCFYKDGNQFTSRGDKYGSDPAFQLKTLLNYVYQKSSKIKYATLFDNTRPAPYDWLHKWNFATGEYQENDTWQEPSPWPTGKDTFCLKKEKKSRILTAQEKALKATETKIITLSSAGNTGEISNVA